MQRTQPSETLQEYEDIVSVLELDKKESLYRTIREINRMMALDAKMLSSITVRKRILESLNPYLRLIRHHDASSVRRVVLSGLNASFWNHFYVSGEYGLVVAKTREPPWL